jgi:hypothetical protein
VFDCRFHDPFCNDPIADGAGRCDQALIRAMLNGAGVRDDVAVVAITLDNVGADAPRSAGELATFSSLLMVVLLGLPPPFRQSCGAD